MNNDQATVANRYKKLESKRNTPLKRARRAAALTLPAICPPEGHNEHSELPKPYQSLGARAVNTLSSKLLLALFPPNSAFFKLGVPADMDLGEIADDIRKQLAQIEQKIVEEQERTKLRAVSADIFKHLLITGNSLLHVSKDGQFRMFGLVSYVVERDPDGNVMELIVCEHVSPQTLPEHVQSLVAAHTEPRDDPEAEVELYTHMVRKDQKYIVYQEIVGQTIPDTQSTHDLESPPFIPLRWSSITNEEYGRGMVDEYIGDFIALDDMSRDLQKASANAAKVIFLRDPNSVLRAKDFTAAKSGAMLTGKKDDVSTVGLEKFADFQITLNRVASIEEQLEKAFLMHTSVQRQAERVTAEEIRFLAQELEDALGGVYSVLAQELQVPLIRRYMHVLAKQRKIPSLKDGDIRLTITTGLEALGRGHDLNKLVGFLKTMAELVGPEQLLQRLDFNKVETRVSTAMGIDATGLFLSQDDFDARQQKQQLQQVASDTIPGLLQSAVKGMKQ